MGSCENTNKKFMVCHIAISPSKTKLLDFETQSITKKVIGYCALATTCLSSWQRPTCPGLFYSYAFLNLTDFYPLNSASA